MEKNKVIVKNGEVLTVLNEGVKTSGVIDLEEARRLLKENVKKIYEMNNAL